MGSIARKALNSNLDGWTLDYNLFRDHVSMDGEPPGQTAQVNPPFNEWADVVKGKAHPKSAGPAVRAGATSMRVEMPPGSDAVWDVDRGPVSKRPDPPDGAEVAQKVDGDYKPNRKPIPDGAEVVGKVDGDYRLKRPRGRRRIPAALKPKSGYKPRGTGARGTKSRVTAPRKIGAFARQVRKG